MEFGARCVGGLGLVVGVWEQAEGEGTLAGVGCGEQVVGLTVHAVRVYAEHVERPFGGVGEDVFVNFVDGAHAVLEEEDHGVGREAVADA